MARPILSRVIAAWKPEACMLFGACACHPGNLSLSRRRLLRAGAAGFVTALIGTLTEASQTARTQPLGAKLPEVDRLAVRIVTDNQVVQFVPSEKREGLAIERRNGNQTPDTPPRTALAGEWGLSMHAQSRRGDEVRNILVDFGYTPETLLNNMSILKIDPANFDALVLSHGHYDHFGGKPGQAQEGSTVLHRRRGLLLHAGECAGAIRHSRPQRDY
jgi:7,8-dihydropterin-6-yl-methyl-4-(beta-D-ribofuranosyl)aminobenzene 5'-phosphate synthase